MARGRRKVPDINSGSTADTAFLLLVSFLITISIDTDHGLVKFLPPPPEDRGQQNMDRVKERSTLQVYPNKDDTLMCDNDYIGIEQPEEEAKEFIANVGNAKRMPEKTRKNVEFFGTTLVNDKHIASLQNDCGSSYQTYISAQNELVAAYNRLKSGLTLQKWQGPYAELNDEQQKAIRKIYPQRIPKAEPKKCGEKRK